MSHMLGSRLPPLVVLAALCAAAPMRAQEPAAVEVAELRRFAVVAGVNFGGQGRPPLRYAVRDARAVAEVLEELGGVAREDLVVLEDPNVDALMGTLTGFAPRMHSGGGAGRVELLFYYSGHSDEEGLLLGEERLSYRALKSTVDALPADVRIVVLDSCSSGALTRLKGGERRAPFLLDASSTVKGHAFLTSSSEDEAAQESDRVGGSYFTHYFVSGLRGAADHSADGKVTLNEAYHYAFQETLRKTEKSAAGPQHAAYDIRLVGTGDLVITDLRAGAADLVLAKDVTGHVLVRRADGTLLAEVRKLDDKARSLSVPPGKYTVRVEDGGAWWGAKVSVKHGERRVVAAGDLDEVPPEKVATRGGGGVITGPAAERMDAAHITSLRESGSVLFYGGIGSSLLGGCCLLFSVPTLAVGLMGSSVDGVRGVSGPCVVSGGACTVMSMLFVAFGAPVAWVGNNRLDEASELEDARAEENGALPKGEAALRY